MNAAIIIPVLLAVTAATAAILALTLRRKTPTSTTLVQILAVVTPSLTGISLPGLLRSR